MDQTKGRSCAEDPGGRMVADGVGPELCGGRKGMRRVWAVGGRELLGSGMVVRKQKVARATELKKIVAFIQHVGRVKPDHEHRYPNPTGSDVYPTGVGFSGERAGPGGSGRLGNGQP